MSDSVAEQISIFRSQLSNRRFDDATLQNLESLLFCKDVKSLMEVISTLREFLKSESLSVIRGTAAKSVKEKLLILESFVLAFALVGDIESCLALIYEGLNFREFKSPSHQWVQVSSMEWLNFAEHSLEAGFYSIARTACENALSRFRRNDTSGSRKDVSLENVQVIKKMKELKDRAVTSAASHSVQAQATEYLKKKMTKRSKRHLSFVKEPKCSASTLFRNGIRIRNAQKLRESRCQWNTIGAES